MKKAALITLKIIFWVVAVITILFALVGLVVVVGITIDLVRLDT